MTVNSSKSVKLERRAESEYRVLPKQRRTSEEGTSSHGESWKRNGTGRDELVDELPNEKKGTDSAARAEVGSLP